MYILRRTLNSSTPVSITASLIYNDGPDPRVRYDVIPTHGGEEPAVWSGLVLTKYYHFPFGNISTCNKIWARSKPISRNPRLWKNQYARIYDRTIAHAALNLSSN